MSLSVHKGLLKSIHLDTKDRAGSSGSDLLRGMQLELFHPAGAGETLAKVYHHPILVNMITPDIIM